MIICRSPLRITLGGGGTDVPSYYREYGGFTVAAAIDRYVYVTLHETFVDDLIVKYSKMERVQDASDIEHPIVREVMAMLNMDGHGLEIASHADIPAGTGLGSSSAFTTALLAALRVHAGCRIDADLLARQACEIEIDRLQEPIGKQDQYMAAYGGLQCLTFGEAADVAVDPLELSSAIYATLEENLLLFFTGYSRSASMVLASGRLPDNLHAVKRLAHESVEALQKGDLHWFAEVLTKQWQAKREGLAGATSQHIDLMHGIGLTNGALGGKLVGAGGGGFLLFYAEDKMRLRRVMQDWGLREAHFRFDTQGTRQIVG